jgi:hypothetical protein
MILDCCFLIGRWAAKAADVLKIPEIPHVSQVPKVPKEFYILIVDC